MHVVINAVLNKLT